MKPKLSPQELDAAFAAMEAPVYPSSATMEAAYKAAGVPFDRETYIKSLPPEEREFEELPTEKAA